MALSDVKVAFGAKVGLVWIVSNEELRIERYISQLADQLKYHSVRMWTLTRGIQPVENPYGLAEDEATKDPLAALKQVYNKDDKKNERVIYIFKGLFPFLDDPSVNRQLRDCNRIIPFSSSENIKQIIILDKKEPPVDSIDATIIKWALPNPEEIKTTINTIVEELPDVIAEKNITEEAKDRVVKAAIGLPINDIVVAVSRSLVSKKELDPVYVLEEKKRMVSRGVGLEWFDPDPRGLDGIGGMHKLKRWLINREKAFSPKAKEFGIPSPRGLILAGVAGAGKSLAAKCIGSAWGMPLLRLDVGSLFSKYVGSSEERTRKALSTIEAVAPAIVWLDEIEKGFGQGGGGDNGTSTRVLGTFLTWMQEKKGEIFVIATANNVAALPPELLRKGRWDELFFVDLPNLEERVEIFKVMKAKFSNVGKLNYKELAENSAGFTGAEIEAILISALYDAFNKDRKVNTKDILNNIIGAVGVKDTNQEQIEALRKWAKGRAINASDESEEVTVPSRQKESRTLEIGAN